MTKSKKVYRSAKTGEFVKKDYAEKHPSTTVKKQSVKLLKKQSR